MRFTLLEMRCRATYRGFESHLFRHTKPVIAVCYRLLPFWFLALAITKWWKNRGGNKYFDTEKPWITRNTDMDSCAEAIFNCTQIIANLSILLEPFLPFSSAKIKSWLSIKNGWSEKNVPIGYTLLEPSILFQRLDKKVVDEELERLRRQQ